MGDGDLFRSFWMGGYEGADHVNSHGVALNLNVSNGHWSQLSEDYARLRAMGIRCIRESVGWRASTNSGAHVDLTALRLRAQTAQVHGLQVIWTIHHYGVPQGVDFFAADFAERFADFCAKVSRALRGTTDATVIYQPVNEISFLSWAVAYSNLVYPYNCRSSQGGYDLKCRLVAATLQGCDAIWAEEPLARIVHTDPIVHIVATPGASPEETIQAQAVAHHQFEAWDMICGNLEPALGGASRYLDILGANYYPDNQWEHPGLKRLHWHLNDERRCSLDDLLGQLWARYRRPLFVAETGHVGDGRSIWLDDVANAALKCLQKGIPLHGICLYPLVDRTDWEEPSRWHRSGLWDVMPKPDAQTDGATIGRVLHEPLAQSLRCWQTVFPPDSFRLTPLSNPPEAIMHPLIVFSHLRWDFVYQRPQQLLSRLASHRQVIFVEEPMPGAERASLERLRPCSGVEVLRCHVTGNSHGFNDENLLLMKGLLAQYVAQLALEDYWLWFYTPMALPLADVLKPAGVVYDCMDELSAFKNAPPELLLREDQLFDVADLVFTGGQSLYEAKSQRHKHVSCFPSSVDAAHYARPHSCAIQSKLATEDMTCAGTVPRLGYCGVIDERIDIDLITALADAHPDWQLVMVGPVVKIDPATLPNKPNIQWLGQQDYADLPGFIHSWDVCLMPFALNESTRFISPTKTLEYLAAGCPVVSTPIRDVVSSYPNIVAIATTPATFISACEAAIQRTPEQIALQAEAVRLLLERTSWDRTANAMALLMAEHGKSVADALEEVEDESEDEEHEVGELIQQQLQISTPAHLIATASSTSATASASASASSLATSSASPAVASSFRGTLKLKGRNLQNSAPVRPVSN